jgi:succinyl-CoA synthetase alpha subunit
MLDVDWGDLIDYLGNDPRTQSIIMYMESVGDARSLLSAAREVSLNKPIIVIKAGRTEAAAQAAASHTGALTEHVDGIVVAPVGDALPERATPRSSTSPRTIPTSMACSPSPVRRAWPGRPRPPSI